MYRNCRYRKNCCQNNYDPEVIEQVCNNVGTIASYSDPEDACQCGFDEEFNPFPQNPMLGQSYVPIQIMDKTFTPCVGLRMGTIFPELISPYVPNQSMKEIEYIEATNCIKGGCNDVRQ